MLRRVLVVLILLASPCFASEQTITDHAEILDGQTIRLRQVVIKLWGIAAPVADEPGASMAAIALYRLYDRNIVTCHMPSNWGAGAAIGKCEAAGFDLGAVLVSNGFALDCPAVSGGHYRVHEQKARARGTIFLTGYELPTHCHTKTK
jgi:endonuclease YncB( thermonuclease family)